ncbi:hypothetical protein UUA_16950 [Rhodanobacter thiooxydans LCS2]|nr:hypothetical protein UUA_16950 [Rhodanobacter thiooxydans LCS2]
MALRNLPGAEPIAGETLALPPAAPLKQNRAMRERLAALDQEGPASHDTLWQSVAFAERIPGESGKGGKHAGYDRTAGNHRPERGSAPRIRP